MVPASFQWNDVGSWDEVAKLHSAVEQNESNEPAGVESATTFEGSGSVVASGAAASGSALSKPVILVEAHDNFVHSDLPVALCGVDGLHVVVKNGMVLVCKRGESQKVKDVVTELKNRGAEELL